MTPWCPHHAWVLAGHRLPDGYLHRRVVVLDAIREVKAPFSPETVTAEFSALLKTYRIYHVYGDHYAKLWPVEMFSRHGQHYEQNAQPKSDLYAALLPLINSRRIALLDHPVLITTVVMVQTAATTRSFPSDPDEPPDVDRDFVGVGAGSILSGLIGAFPVNASPPRTAIVSETGGRSQLTGLVAAVIVLALLAFGATLLRHVPHAALGGVLLFVALSSVSARSSRSTGSRSANSC